MHGQARRAEKTLWETKPANTTLHKLSLMQKHSVWSPSKELPDWLGLSPVWSSRLWQRGHGQHQRAPGAPSSRDTIIWWIKLCTPFNTMPKDFLWKGAMSYLVGTAARQLCNTAIRSFHCSNTQCLDRLSNTASHCIQNRSLRSPESPYCDAVWLVSLCKKSGLPHT